MAQDDLPLRNPGASRVMKAREVKEATGRLPSGFRFKLVDGDCFLELVHQEGTKETFVARHYLFSNSPSVVAEFFRGCLRRFQAR